MRIACGLFVVREVLEDASFSVEEQTYKLRKGDLISLVPPLFNSDEETFAEPKKFKFDRFLPTRTFCRDGRQLENPLLAFGALCPAQQLAMLQCTWTVLSLLHSHELELLPGERTDFDRTCYGHEFLPPTADVRIRICTRSPLLLQIRDPTLDK